MNKIKRGKIFIYNVYFFPNAYGNRIGSENDVVALRRAFKRINADNEIEDLSDDTLEHITQPEPTRVRPADGLSDKERLKQKIKARIIEQDFRAFDYVAFAVMSHGGEKSLIHLYDGDCLLEETFLDPLIQNNSLARKLKWIISNSCRGTKIHISRNFSGATTELSFLNYRYFLVSLATTEGYKAFRPKTGSIFIQALCSVLEHKKRPADILDIVNEEVPKEVKNQISLSLQRPTDKFRFIQTPTQETNLNLGEFFF